MRCDRPRFTSAMVDHYAIILTEQTRHLKSCADIIVGAGVDAHVVVRCNVNTVSWVALA